MGGWGARLGVLVVVVVSAVGAFGACASSGAPDLTDPSTSVAAATTEPAPEPSGGPATDLLAGLRVGLPPADLPPYRRDAFGPDGWDYDPTTGCNTRKEVLQEESSPPAEVAERCKVLRGRWVSLYDGVVVTDPADLQIDHLVPLADAWRSGAASWSDARRHAFANDTSRPETLIAVTGHTNQSKGDSAPDEWLPPAPRSWCTYVTDWVQVKARWRLSVTPAERTAIARILATC